VFFVEGRGDAKARNGIENFKRLGPLGEGTVRGFFCLLNGEVPGVFLGIRGG